jgi:hypothetical protein
MNKLCRAEHISQQINFTHSLNRQRGQQYLLSRFTQHYLAELKSGKFCSVVTHSSHPYTNAEEEFTISITYSFVTTHPWGNRNCLLIESGISRKSNRGILPMTRSSPSFGCALLLIGRLELILPPMVCLLCCPSAGLTTFFWEGASDLLISCCNLLIMSWYRRCDREAV